MIGSVAGVGGGMGRLEMDLPFLHLEWSSQD